MRSDEIKAGGKKKRERGREAIKPLLVLAMSGLILRQRRKDGKLSNLKGCSCLNRRWSEKGREEERFYLLVWMRGAFPSLWRLFLVISRSVALNAQACSVV